MAVPQQNTAAQLSIPPSRWLLCPSALGAGLLAGCDKGVGATTSAARPAMKVTIVKAEQSDVPLTGEWVGTLDGYVNAQIQPQANGYLIRQNYREGSQVAKDQVFFEIDPRPFEAALDQAKDSWGRRSATGSRTDQCEPRHAAGRSARHCQKPTRQRDSSRRRKLRLQSRRQRPRWRRPISISALPRSAR